MSEHTSFETGHAPRPFGTALGIFMGLLVWWTAGGVLVWVLYKLMTTGEPE